MNAPHLLYVPFSECFTCRIELLRNHNRTFHVFVIDGLPSSNTDPPRDRSRPHGWVSGQALSEVPWSITESLVFFEGCLVLGFPSWHQEEYVPSPFTRISHLGKLRSRWMNSPVFPIRCLGVCGNLLSLRSRAELLPARAGRVGSGCCRNLCPFFRNLKRGLFSPQSLFSTILTLGFTANPKLALRAQSPFSDINKAQVNGIWIRATARGDVRPSCSSSRGTPSLPQCRSGIRGLLRIGEEPRSGPYRLVWGARKHLPI
jgi:hypothetical protein